MRKYKRPHFEPSQTSSSVCEQWRSYNLLHKDTRIGDSRPGTLLGLLCSHTEPDGCIIHTSLKTKIKETDMVRSESFVTQHVTIRSLPRIFEDSGGQHRLWTLDTLSNRV